MDFQDPLPGDGRNEQNESKLSRATVKAGPGVRNAQHSSERLSVGRIFALPQGDDGNP